MERLRPPLAPFPERPPDWYDGFAYPDGPLIGQDGWTADFSLDDSPDVAGGTILCPLSGTGGASNGTALAGVDFDGDWLLEVDLIPPATADGSTFLVVDLGDPLGRSLGLILTTLGDDAEWWTVSLGVSDPTVSLPSSIIVPFRKGTPYTLGVRVVGSTITLEVQRVPLLAGTLTMLLDLDGTQADIVLGGTTPAMCPAVDAISFWQPPPF